MIYCIQFFFLSVVKFEMPNIFVHTCFMHMVKAYSEMLMYNKVQLATVVPIVFRQRALVTQWGMARVEWG